MSVDDRLEELGIRLARREIGNGGSAVVHNGVVTNAAEGLPPVDSAVAVKEYHRSLLSVPGQVERVRQEFELGRTLEHPNVVKSYRLITYSNDDGSQGALLVLEWIDGMTLDEWQRSRPKDLQWETLRAIALDIVSGLEALHARNVLHRDLKPENVMIRKSGEAVIMDIGVAEVTDDNDHTMHTSVKDFVGSVRFAAPQFILGEPFVAADDIYSLGATLLLLLTGKQIYHEVERKPVLPIAVVNTSPKIDSLLDGVPASMQVVLAGALNRDRKRRPTLAQLRECLANPETADYITNELEQQAAESRTYPVINVMENGGHFLVDLGGDTVDVDDVFEVVRPGRRITVPSYQREITPEIWVASAVLKHVNANVGHFIVLKKRWQEGKPASALSSSIYGTPGQWIHDEAVKMTVAKGDLVLRKRPE